MLIVFFYCLVFKKWFWKKFRCFDIFDDLNVNKYGLLFNSVNIKQRGGKTTRLVVQITLLIQSFIPN